MKFIVARDELKKASILEFKGEFEKLDDIEMDIQEDKILFKTSFIKSQKKAVAKNIILKVQDGRIEPHAIGIEHLLFDKPPKYISKCKKRIFHRKTTL
ncbi:hypothetical protein NERG_01013 [Nematocida ausubeli]|uniref:Uncharacterized protein n=1 Tax=Nematocida ausubeli (strain ATCC PRA-371 / ERTm2) TaxID=1913371 RepID=H8ZBR4_NEMA1|nr:hypothetical protein NERG_01013 [Nematocida ausubeli]